MRRSALVVMVALIVPGVGARADVFDDVQRQIAPLKMKRLAEQAAATKEAERLRQKQIAELEKAEQKVREAQARLDKIAEEARKAREKAEEAAKRVAEQGEARVGQAKQGVEGLAKDQAKQKERAAQIAEEAKREKARAQAVGDAAKALDAAVAAVAAGRGDVDKDLDAAKKDEALGKAAQAVGGMAAYLKGDDKRALALLTPEVIETLPSARRYAALARLRLGDKENAWKDLRASQIAPSDAVAQLAIGKLAIERGEQETARAAFALAYAADPGSREAGMGLARALLALGKPGEAMAPLSALAGDPSNHDATYLLAVASERAGASHQAELAFGSLLGRDGGTATSSPSQARRGRPIRVAPTHPLWTTPPAELDATAARLRFAWYRLQHGDADGAQRVLGSLAGLEARADAHYLRGLARLRAGRLDGARADLVEAAKLASDRGEPKQALGVALLEAGDAKSARDLLTPLAGDDLAQVALAVAESQIGDRVTAQARLSKLTSSKDALAADAAATDLAAILREEGQADDALRIAPERPLTAEGWRLRGLLLERGDGKRAEAAYRAAVEIAPNYVDAWIGLGSALEPRDAAGAQQAVERALEIAPECIEARALLARIYGKQGDTARQAAELAKIRELGEQVSGAAGKRHAIAVVAFENNTGDASLDWMRQGIAEALVSDMGRLGALQIIERTQIQKGFAEQKLQELGLAEPGRLGKVGKLIGADALLVGTISKSGDQVRLDGRVVEVGTNQVLKTGSAVGRAADIFDVERRLAIDLVSEYAAVTARERADFFGAKKPSMETLASMARIRMLSSEGKAHEAKEAYEKLLVEDPKAAEKLKELQKGWEDVAATVAIVPLQNVSAHSEDSWLGVGIAEALTTDLKKAGLFLVERGQVEKLMQERRLTEIFNAEQAVSLGKLLGASMLLMGSYQVLEGKLRVDARLVDISNAQVMQSYTVDGKKDELFEVESKLVREIASALKVEPTKMEKAQLASAKPSLEDFKRYIQSSSRLVLKDAPGRPEVIRALALAPVKEATGGVDKEATRTLRQALERNGTVAVHESASAEPGEARGDALVIGTVTRAGDKERIDVRAVFASGEVAASATSVGAPRDLPKTEDQAARNLLSGLGLRRVATDEEPTDKPAYKKWYTWLGVVGGLAVAGGAVGVGVALGDRAHEPSADSTITAH